MCAREKTLHPQVLGGETVGVLPVRSILDGSASCIQPPNRCLV